MIRKLLLVALVLCTQGLFAQYYPPSGDWEEKAPDEVGMDGDDIQEAISFAQDNQSIINS
ncbi:MAG: hypothetical protein AAF391_05120 [Bacteroidota bacterium]